MHTITEGLTKICFIKAAIGLPALLVHIANRISNFCYLSLDFCNLVLQSYIVTSVPLVTVLSVASPDLSLDWLTSLAED